MATYTYAQFRTAILGAGLDKVVFQSGWDDPNISPFQSSPDTGVMLHHTANGGAKGNAPSLYWCLNNEYAPVRAAHCLIGRDGTVHILSGRGSYHAGAGGPMVLDGATVPADQGNRHLFGIEIESKGTNPSVRSLTSDVDGITPAQVRSAVLVSAAVLLLMGRDAKSLIRHRDWAPGRKNDVLQPLPYWRGKVRRRLAWLRLQRAAARVAGRKA